MARKTKKTSQKNSVFISRSIFWLRRAGLGGAVLIGLLWLGAWLWLSGSVTAAARYAHNSVMQVTVDGGFAVSDVLVEGRVHTDPDVLMALVNTQKGEPIFEFDPDGAQEQIAKIAWVKDVRVERRLPGTIYVRLEERVPLALWQINENRSVIDQGGAVITDYKLERFADLITVKGVAAAERAPELFQNLNAQPDVMAQIQSAAWVGDRRWDLTLKSGALVKLPEKDAGFALSRLALAQEDDALLDRDVRSIDVRENDRIIIRTKPGKVQNYKANYAPKSDI